MTCIDIDGLSMKEIERKVIMIKIEQLKKFKKVAEELKIGRTTLWRKTKEYALEEN